MTLVAGSDSRLLPDHPWVVAARSNGDGVAGVSRIGDELVVLVGDDSSRRAGTLARLNRAGDAEVQCQHAPQAMLVAEGEVAMVPALPGLIDSVHMGPRDYLVLCSAAVLEHLPCGMAYVIERARERGGPVSVDDLLDEMLSYAKSGGVALVHRGTATAA